MSSPSPVEIADLTRGTSAPTTRPTLTGTFGMSATTHWLATATSQSVLERGGNAFDASCAAAFVLHIVEPHLNGPGGDMVGVFATAEKPDSPVIMDGQGPAPAGASVAAYRQLGLEFVPGSGALAAAVPAAVDSWLRLLHDHGTWELADVLDYAIGYAENGHQIVPRVASTIASVKDLFTQHWPSSAELWMPGGKAPEPGQTMTNPAYAKVLRGLIAAGEGADTREGRIQAARREWSTGTVAKEIEAFVRTPHMHANGQKYAGVITAQDMAEHESGYTEPLSIEFRGYTIAKQPAWGQGPTLLMALKILDGFDDENLDPSTELGAHTILETLKLVLADRDTYFGDTDLDMDHLLSDEYAAQRRALITERASHEFQPGTVPGASGHLPPLMTAAEFAATPEGQAAGLGAGEPTVPGARGGKPTVDAQGDTPAARAGAEIDVDSRGVTRGDTCHIDVVDQWGNMISATPSGGWLQSSPTIPALGFCLGTRLQMTWLDESSPSRLEPGRKPRTTLTPTLISKDGQPVIALGTPGGDQQDQWQLLLILRLLVLGMDPQAAIDAPAFHTTSMPGSFYPRTWTPGGTVVEDRLGDDVIAGLESRGHAVTRAGDWALGRLSCVIRDPASGKLAAAANPRGNQGYAAGR